MIWNYFSHIHSLNWNIPCNKIKSYVFTISWQVSRRNEHKSVQNDFNLSIQILGIIFIYVSYCCKCISKKRWKNWLKEMIYYIGKTINIKQSWFCFCRSKYIGTSLPFLNASYFASFIPLIFSSAKRHRSLKFKKVFEKGMVFI